MGAAVTDSHDRVTRVLSQKAQGSCGVTPVTPLESVFQHFIREKIKYFPLCTNPMWELAVMPVTAATPAFPPVSSRRTTVTPAVTQKSKTPHKACGGARCGCGLAPAEAPRQPVQPHLLLVLLANVEVALAGLARDGNGPPR